jgi:SAM-dependent methyltransferase
MESAMSHLIGSGFENVDRTSDPAARVSYLDAVAALEGARAYKQHSFALMRLKPGDTVLELGCGTGDDLRSLAELVGSSGRVVGVDLSETMIAQAHMRTEKLPVECYVGDAYRLEFESDMFDACRVDRVFQHLERPRDAFAELVRVTRSGGRVVAAEPDWDTLVVDAADKAVTRVVRERICDDHRQGWIGRQLAGLAGESDLGDVAVTGVTVLFTDWSQASQLLGLADAAVAAVAEGLVAPEAAAAWIDELVRRDRAGRFFSAATIFVVAGSKTR